MADFLMRFAFLVRIYTAARGLMRKRWGRERGEERLLPSTPLPPFSGWTSFRLPHDCMSYLPTTKEKTKHNIKKHQLCSQARENGGALV